MTTSGGPTGYTGPIGVNGDAYVINHTLSGMNEEQLNKFVIKLMKGYNTNYDFLLSEQEKQLSYCYDEDKLIETDNINLLYPSQRL